MQRETIIRRMDFTLDDHNDKYQKGISSKCKSVITGTMKVAFLKDYGGDYDPL